MALGKFSDRNHALVATLSGGSWSGSLPLTNLQDDVRYVAAPARQLTPAVLANAQFDATLDSARAVSLVAVLFHTLSLGAKYRLTIAGPGGSLASPVYQSAWTDVFPRVFDISELAWEDDNYWTGQIDTADLDLYPRHLWIALSADVIAIAVRLEFDDALNGAGYFDLGGLWIASGWSPAFNFERGRQLSIDPRDQLDEAPSGRIFSEERTPRRTMSASWSLLSDAEALKLFDAGARARTTRPVIFAPDVDDASSLLREAFPATFGPPPAPTFKYDGLNAVSATFREIIA
jgi:hypothetical protein